MKVARFVVVACASVAMVTAAYYPYVQDCPSEWQPVLPTPPDPEG